MSVKIDEKGRPYIEFGGRTYGLCPKGGEDLSDLGDRTVSQILSGVFGELPRVLAQAVLEARKMGFDNARAGFGWQGVVNSLGDHADIIPWSPCQ